MPSDPRQPRQRLPSQPEIQAATVDKLVGRATDMVGATTRKQTFTGLGALKSPALPAEYSPTQRAPSTTAATARPTPPAGIEAGKAEDAPASLQGDQEAVLRKALDAERAKVAEFERQARVKAETASPASFPPAIIPAPPKPPVVATEPQTDEVLTWLVKRAVANRKAIYALVAAMGIGGGGVAIKTATDKPAPPPLTAAQLDAALDKLKTRKGGFDDQTRLLNDQLQLTKCLRRKVTQIGESVLPAPDHMGAQRKPQPFEDDCMDSPKPLPDP